MTVEFDPYWDRAWDDAEPPTPQRPRSGAARALLAAIISTTLLLGLAAGLAGLALNRTIDQLDHGQISLAPTAGSRLDAGLRQIAGRPAAFEERRYLGRMADGIADQWRDPANLVRVLRGRVLDPGLVGNDGDHLSDHFATIALQGPNQIAIELASDDGGLGGVDLCLGLSLQQPLLWQLEGIGWQRDRTC